MSSADVNTGHCGLPSTAPAGGTPRKGTSFSPLHWGKRTQRNGHIMHWLLITTCSWTERQFGKKNKTHKQSHTQNPNWWLLTSALISLPASPASLPPLALSAQHTGLRSSLLTAWTQPKKDPSAHSGTTKLCWKGLKRAQDLGQGLRSILARKRVPCRGSAGFLPTWMTSLMLRNPHLGGKKLRVSTPSFKPTLPCKTNYKYLHTRYSERIKNEDTLTKQKDTHKILPLY